MFLKSLTISNPDKNEAFKLNLLSKVELDRMLLNRRACVNRSELVRICSKAQKEKRRLSRCRGASRDVRRGAGVLDVAADDVVVVVGLRHLLPGIHRHLPRNSATQ